MSNRMRIKELNGGRLTRPRELWRSRYRHTRSQGQQARTGMVRRAGAGSGSPTIAGIFGAMARLAKVQSTARAGSSRSGSK